jgi:HK97 family phage portal protein
MGLGQVFHRDLHFDVTDTNTGQVVHDYIVTGTGAYPNWEQGAYGGAMAIPGAWRASILLSDLLGRIPWHRYRMGGSGTPERLPGSPLLEQPCPPQTRMTSFAAWGLDLLFHGNAIGLVSARDRQGYPTAISPVSAKSVYVRRAERDDRTGAPPGTVVYQIGNKWYRSDDVFHVMGPSEPGQLRGMGVLECHLRGTLALAGTLAEQARSVSDAAVPSLVMQSLNPDLDATEAAALKLAVQTSQRTRSPLVVGPSVEVTPIAWNPSETQLIEARKLSLVEIANLFGLDADRLNAAQTSRTYQNVEQAGITFLRDSAGGWIARFEQTLSLAFPRGTWVEANLDNELRADTKTRYEAHAIAITSGILTRDEVRAIENRPPLTPAQREELMPAPPAASSPAGSGPSRSDFALARSADDDLDEYVPVVLDDEELRASNSIKDYWLHGEGLAKWATSAHPWGSLYRHLKKHMNAAMAKRVASQWFFEHFGYWSGSRKGSNPVGKG